MCARVLIEEVSITPSVKFVQIFLKGLNSS
jgi:hypothetical protein